jgi:hypothetical protein
MSDVQRLMSKKKGIGVKTPQTLAILKGLPKKKRREVSRLYKQYLITLGFSQRKRRENRIM